LALATTELVRISLRHPPTQPDEIEQFPNLSGDTQSILRSVYPIGFRQRLKDRHPRMERGCRVLKNHLNLSLDREWSIRRPGREWLT
jgi:hypothetical protein